MDPSDQARFDKLLDAMTQAMQLHGLRDMGLPRFQGQVDRGHAMTTRLSIDELTHQDQASIHGAAKGGGC